MALEANINSESMVDIIADNTMAINTATNIVGKKLSVIIVSTSSPLLPKIALQSNNSSRKYLFNCHIKL